MDRSSWFAVAVGYGGVLGVGYGGVLGVVYGGVGVALQNKHPLASGPLGTDFLRE